MGKSNLKHQKNVFSAVGGAVNNLLQHKQILYPFALIAFVQLLILEILYFYPRFPLNTFFAPLVSKLWSPQYMHYPANFSLLPKLFQSTQVPVYILINSFFIGVAIAIILAINNDQKINLKKIYRETWGRYVHLAVAAALMFVAIFGLFKIYSLVYSRALEIRSTTGFYFWIKSIVVVGAPFFQFLISIIVTTVFAYVIPIIVIEKKNVFTAVLLNLKLLARSCFFTFFVVAIPSVFYVLIMVIRMTLTSKLPVIDWSLGLIIINILVLILIDAIVYTALSTFYLLQKESA